MNAHPVGTRESRWGCGGLGSVQHRGRVAHMCL